LTSCKNGQSEVIRRYLKQEIQQKRRRRLLLDWLSSKVIQERRQMVLLPAHLVTTVLKPKFPVSSLFWKIKTAIKFPQLNSLNWDLVTMILIGGGNSKLLNATDAMKKEKISTTKSIVQKGQKRNEANGVGTSTPRSKGHGKITTSSIYWKLTARELYSVFFFLVVNCNNLVILGE